MPGGDDGALREVLPWPRAEPQRVGQPRHQRLVGGEGAQFVPVRVGLVEQPALRPSGADGVGEIDHRHRGVGGQVLHQLCGARLLVDAAQPVWHELRIDGVLVWGNHEQVGDAPRGQPVVGALQRGAPDLELGGGEAVGGGVVGDGAIGGVVQPALFAEQHVGGGRHAEALDTRARLPADQRRAEGEVVGEVARESVGPGHQRGVVGGRRRQRRRVAVLLRRAVGVHARDGRHQRDGHRQHEERGEDSVDQRCETRHAIRTGSR
jgi:hypothetical protein